MKREQLVAARRPRWRQLESLLRVAEKPLGAPSLGPQGIQELASLYRALAGDLMRVRRDRLGADLERYLDGLASRGHNALYAHTKSSRAENFVALALEFPAALRRNARFLLFSSVLFFGPVFIAGLAAYESEHYALQILSREQLDAMEAMHKQGHELGRAADEDAAATGFYIWNNIGIAFRCFATGIFFGLGSVFYLVFNGLNIGVIFGHLARVGQGENIFSFAATHSAWELIAIVISGAAGLQMGYALVKTYGRTRLGHLQAHGLELLRQIFGAALLLFIAALLEAWVSPSSLPVEVKYAFGLAGWILVPAFLALAGRGRPPPVDVVALKESRK